MNQFLRRYNELMSDLEHKMTAQANLANEQNELIERLTNENQAYKAQLELLSKKLDALASNSTTLEQGSAKLIEKLNSENRRLASENERLTSLLQSNKGG